MNMSSTDHTTLSYYSSVFVCTTLGELAYTPQCSIRNSFQGGVHSGCNPYDFKYWVIKNEDI